jgi:RNA-binding protein
LVLIAVTPSSDVNQVMTSYNSYQDILLFAQLPLSFRERANRFFAPSINIENLKYAITLTLLFFERGMCLQRLGKVLHVTPSQNVIVKADKTPKIGSAVVNEKIKVVGKVFDVIGPVSSPYVVIRPTIKDPEKIMTKQLYLLLSKKRRSKKQ